jgi:hypothetical protein
MSRATTRCFALAGLVLVAAPLARAHLVSCRNTADAGRIADALRRIRESVDPCGESDDVTAVLKKLESCPGARYEICTSATAARNLYDRRTVTWNPDLRSELEPACDADGAAVTRDPAASLLHELVHAADECEGRNPGAHELDAVRIENIYRRAAGLRQRTRYGDDPLPRAMIRPCEPGRCACALAGPAPALAGAGPALGRPLSRVTR